MHQSIQLQTLGSYRTAPHCSADSKAGGTLINTLRTVADADMNMQKAGRKLGVHPNTVYLRIERIKLLTGLDGHRYRDLTEMLLAADCCRNYYSHAQTSD